MSAKRSSALNIASIRPTLTSTRSETRVTRALARAYERALGSTSTSTMLPQMKRIANLGDHFDLFILKFGGEVDLWSRTLSFLQLGDLVAERHGTSRSHAAIVCVRGHEQFSSRYGQ